jgi:hypothetical protein
MSEDLKKGDEVYIEKWNAYGVIVSIDSDKGDDNYKVEMKHYFRRSDLKLVEASSAGQSAV